MTDKSELDMFFDPDAKLMSDVMNEFCRIKNIEAGTVRLVFNGKKCDLFRRIKEYSGNNDTIKLWVQPRLKGGMGKRGRTSGAEVGGESALQQMAESLFMELSGSANPGVDTLLTMFSEISSKGKENPKATLKLLLLARDDGQLKRIATDMMNANDVASRMKTLAAVLFHPAYQNLVNHIDQANKAEKLTNVVAERQP